MNDCKWISKASFQTPKFYLPRLPSYSAWLEHGPFAFWLVENQQPRSIVELGSQYGFSYLCFCQQVASMQIDAKCYAIDTWRGDQHVGFYNDNVFVGLKRFNDALYGSFSTLVRAKFSEALERFDDKTIDLLHIDGRHYYDDVKEDFESWAPKLSERSIVLFHDTQVRERGFGVYKFWDEIRRNYPSFEFIHGYGLGVLSYGVDKRTRELPIFSGALSEAEVSAIRGCYKQLGRYVYQFNPIHRNSECPCGSGKRYKHCHGALAVWEAVRGAKPPLPEKGTEFGA
jgi:hypothetical protein